MRFVNEMRLDFPARPENEAFARMCIAAFLLPADPRYFGNLPEVQSVTEQNGLYTVSVVCRPEQPSWYQTEAPVVRHSEFIMKQAHGTWQIAALHTDAPDAQNEEETEPTHEQEDD